MNQDEYEIFYERSYKHHVQELMDEEHMSREEAEKESANELAGMLPEGMDTKDNFLMSIHRSEDDAQIGFIWTLHEMTEAVKQNFICDFEIYEVYRRKGYAKETLELMEKEAKTAGCAESVLFVTNDNEAANALYEKCGYQFLRDMEYGRYMKKNLEKMKMEGLQFIVLREKKELKEKAAQWFHEKWGVPKEAYLECMDAYLSGETEFGWYICMDGDRIAGGLGVIENDFHDRKDLAPNVCAVYTEEEYRCRGIAGRLLDLVVEDQRAHGVSPLYLVTDHTGFYERYGWEFYCMAQGDDEPEQTRLYKHE